MSYPYTPVQSSNVAGVAYDDKTRKLEVTFKNGATYEYEGVQPSVGNGMPFAASKGQFVWQVLRDQYSYRKL